MYPEVPCRSRDRSRGTMHTNNNYTQSILPTFSNVIGTFGIPFFAMMVFHDKMNGVKIIAILVSICGFVSYVYNHYLEDTKARKASA
jgi:hypothetical protein